MNRLSRNIWNTFLLVTLFSVFISSCNSSSADVVEDGYYYTCSMHPQIHELHPGTCPICGMDLIKVKITQTAPDEVQLNEDQIRLGNIVVDTISFLAMADDRIITGIVTEDEQHSEAVTTRISGRLDRLYFKDVGVFVKKGQPVFSIYSEELNNAQQELLTLVEKREVLGNSLLDFDHLIATSKKKLSFLGLSDKQIDNLIRNKTVSDLTTYYSPYSGYITELPVFEGDYTGEGSVVMRLADLSRVWVEAQVYLSQLSSFREGEKLNVEFPDLGGETIRGTVSFISPEILPDSRLVPVRISVPNLNGKLKPGMNAYVKAGAVPVAELTLPSDAVIRDSERNIAWVQKDEGIFEWREVKLGKESNRRVAILSGLQEGDRVVVNGAYLLNSEYVLKKETGQ